MDSSLIGGRAIRALPIKLNDHLLDDMTSSSSSNGFNSFPRSTSQCCTTLRFREHKTPSKSPLSAFRRAVSAVKRLPFAAAKPPEKIKLNCSSLLGQSFSRMILERSGFWKKKKKKKKKKEIGRWRSFDELTVSGDGKYSSPEVNLFLQDVVKDGAGNGAVSTDSKQWRQSDQEKEQLSPVSVLDCPFDDECCTGTKMKLMRKIQRFECLEPVSLATQFALQSDNSDNESFGSPLPLYSSSIDENFISNIEEEEEDKAFELVYHKMKANYSPSYPDDLKLIEDKLLRDLSREIIADKCANPENMSAFDEGHLLEETENWKKTRGHSIEWEVRKNRQAYVDGMEKRGGWRTLDREREEVALGLEYEVFVDLVNEALLDIDRSI